MSATVLHPGKLRPERMNEQTILWHTASGCGDAESPTGVPARWSSHPSPGYPHVLPVCLSTEKSDAIFGNCRRPGSQPLHTPYNLSPSLMPPEAGSIGLEGWSLEQVPGVAWPALGSQVGLLSSIPRSLRSWQGLLMLFPYNHLWLPIACGGKANSDLRSIC